MNYSPVQLNDFSDELLLCILDQLNNMDALYSLVGVNQRLDRIVRDVTYTRDIDLMKTPAASAHERFCVDILPRIHHNIECLVLDSSIIERALLAGSYPRLHKLTLFKPDYRVAFRLLKDHSPFAHIFKEQILQLIVILPDNNVIMSWIEASSNVFRLIIKTFSNLMHLDYGCSDPRLSSEVSFDVLSANACFSSTLVDLRVGVDDFDDCLRLLDGRLEHLQRLIVDLDLMRDEPPIVDNTKALPKLKCFSLTNLRRIRGYDSRIVPLLRRMSNLEELALFLTIEGRSTFIDGTELDNEILVHMARLRNFNFNIRTLMVPTNGMLLRSSDDIRRTFVSGRGYINFDCYVDYFPNDTGRCHVYSRPYTKYILLGITNNFPGGQFNSVRSLSLMDIGKAFEHELFVRIARDFPLLAGLAVLNIEPQKHKRPRHLFDNEQATPIVVYPHLIELVVAFAHIDYTDQFLLETNTRLPCLSRLRIKYEHLLDVTHVYTNDVARVNCAKVKCLSFPRNKSVVLAEKCYRYFPLLPVVNKR